MNRLLNILLADVRLISWRLLSSQKKGPCKKKADPCKKKADPCKKEKEASSKKADPCKKKEGDSDKKSVQSHCSKVVTPTAPRCKDGKGGTAKK